MVDTHTDEGIARIVVDPFQGKKPTMVRPFNPRRTIAEAEGIVPTEKSYSPSHPAMYGMAVDGAIHNALSGEEQVYLSKYCDYLVETFGQDYANQFIEDSHLAADQVKEQLLPVIGDRVPFFVRGAPLGTPSTFEEQLYLGMKNPNFHSFAEKMGYPSLAAMLLEASQNPHFFRFKNGSNHTTDIRKLYTSPLPEHILNPDMAKLLINASTMGHHVHRAVSGEGIVELQNYLKRHTAIPDVMAILVDSNPKYHELQEAAQEFIEGTDGTEYFGKKFLGDISSLDERTLKAGSKLAHNAIAHPGKNMTWLPPVSFLFAEGKTIVHPTYTAQNLTDKEKVTDMDLINKWAEDFGETINAARLTWFNIYDTGKTAPKNRDEDSVQRKAFEDGMFSFQNNYALAVTRMTALDENGLLLPKRELPVSRIVHIPPQEALRLANQARAKVG